MVLRKPNAPELKRLAKENHFSLSREEIDLFRKRIGRILKSYERLDSLGDSIVIRSRSNTGHRPKTSENRFGGWAWKCSIKEKSSGLLHGKRIAIKDNVSVAGVPLRNGSPMLGSYFPREDATIVTRILAAGGEITGKSQCENLCVSGGSHTSFPGPVRNPHNPRYMAGGSSSGSAALLASGEVDLAIGGDQAGSIRIPSSWCGVYGLKPTWGLVPYTGVIPMEMSIDHVGPMANNVSDLALLLQAIAGKDGFDPRQLNVPNVLPDYFEELERGVNGLRIGVVEEGFGLEGLSEPDVDEIVRREAYVFEELGANVRDVSIPEHYDGLHIWSGIVNEGTWNTMVRDNGPEHGFYDIGFIARWAEAKRRMSSKLPPTMKLIALLGNFFSEEYNGRYFALAQKLKRNLREKYDAALERFDTLIIPTTPQKAQLLGNMSPSEYLDATMSNLYNTCPFDVTGHPAINVPCGLSNGLPIGMMIVGKHFEESTLLRAAYAYEKQSPKMNECFSTNF